jgi:hypothetical protein
MCERARVCACACVSAPMHPCGCIRAVRASECTCVRECWCARSKCAPVHGQLCGHAHGMRRAYPCAPGCYSAADMWLLLLLPILYPLLHLQAWEEVKSGSGYASEAGMQLADISNYLLSKVSAHLLHDALCSHASLHFPGPCTCIHFMCTLCVCFLYTTTQYQTLVNFWHPAGPSAPAKALLVAQRHAECNSGGRRCIS